MVKKLLSGLVLSAAVIVFSAAAQPPDKDCPHAKMRPADELNLTDEQATQLKLLRLDMQKEQIMHGSEVKKIREKIKAEMLKEKPSKTVLTGYAEELGKLHAKLSTKRVENLLKVKDVLNKEQFEKLLSKEFLEGMCRDKKECKGGKMMMHHGMKGGDE